MSSHAGQEIIGIGIDVGMTYTGGAMCYRTYGHEQCDDLQLGPFAGTPKFPSQVFVPRNGVTPLSVGKNALDQAALSRQGRTGVLYSLFKLLLGKVPEWTDASAGRTVTAHSLTVELLRKVKAEVERELALPARARCTPRYAFSYPGVWGDSQIKSFEDAIEEAEFSPGYLLISEPIATALAAARRVRGEHLLAPEHVVLVCDLGGGTLDLALVTVSPAGVIEAQAGTDGQADLGMSNLDKILALIMLHRADLELAPEANALLGLLPMSDSTTVTSLPQAHATDGASVNAAWKSIEAEYDNYWRSELLRHGELRKLEVCRLWNLQDRFTDLLPNGLRTEFSRDADVRPFIEDMNLRVKRAVERFLRDVATNAHLARRRITHIVVSGGGSGLPGIEETLADLLPNRKVTHIEPTIAGGMVQQGAAMFAYEPARVTGLRFKATYGILISDPEPPDGITDLRGWKTRRVPRNGEQTLCYDKFHRVFRRHEPVPATPKVMAFPSIGDGDEKITFDLRCGEHDNPHVNAPIDLLKVPIPKEAKAGYMVNLCFTPLQSGRMRIDAIDPKTGAQDSTDFGDFADPPML